MFNHSNIQILASIDRLLRYFIVTPDMHRVHHSVIKIETNSNYGFNIPWWDYIFRTYRRQPKNGHIKISDGQAIPYRKARSTQSYPLPNERISTPAMAPI